MKGMSAKANIELFFANLFRLPVAALAVLSLVLVHGAYYLTTECGRSIFARTDLARNENQAVRQRRADLIVDSTHKYSREIVLLLWAIFFAYLLWK